MRNQLDSLNPIDLGTYVFDLDPASNTWHLRPYDGSGSIPAVDDRRRSVLGCQDAFLGVCFASAAVRVMDV